MNDAPIINFCNVSVLVAIWHKLAATMCFDCFKTFSTLSAKIFQIICLHLLMQPYATSKHFCFV